MFREMRRFKQQVSQEDCVNVLKESKRGVLSVIGDDGYPFGVPLNYYYDEEEGRIYFHGSKSGHKIDAIKSCPKACFTTWREDGLEEGEWWYHVTSVIAMGTAELVDDYDIACEKARKLAYKYYPNQDFIETEMKKNAKNVQVIALKVEHMTGKHITEK